MSLCMSKTIDRLCWCGILPLASLTPLPAGDEHDVLVAPQCDVARALLVVPGGADWTLLACAVADRSRIPRPMRPEGEPIELGDLSPGRPVRLRIRYDGLRAREQFLGNAVGQLDQAYRWPPVSSTESAVLRSQRRGLAERRGDLVDDTIWASATSTTSAVGACATLRVPVPGLSVVWAVEVEDPQSWLVTEFTLDAAQVTVQGGDIPASALAVGVGLGMAIGVAAREVCMEARYTGNSLGAEIPKLRASVLVSRPPADTGAGAGRENVRRAVAP